MHLVLNNFYFAFSPPSLVLVTMSQEQASLTALNNMNKVPEACATVPHWY